MDLLTIGKAVGRMVVGSGVTAVVANLVKTTSPAQQTVIQKVLTTVGGMTITYWLQDQVGNWVEAEIEKTFKPMIDALETPEENQKEVDLSSVKPWNLSANKLDELVENADNGLEIVNGALESVGEERVTKASMKRNKPA